MNATLIATSGAPGTGRTATAVNKLLDLEAAHPDKTVCFIHNLERDCPYPLGRDATTETMLWLFTARVQKELTLMKRGRYVVADQTIVDVIAHTI
ncbi:MAG: hypothetical protein MI892_24675, partial [Desulfobacterales bacterium]|nr:hypothetical protein [Desulfobacterales bacterium]